MNNCETQQMVCNCFLPEAIENEADSQSNSGDSLYSVASLEEMLCWRIRECREYQAHNRYTRSEESSNWRNTAQFY